MTKLDELIQELCPNGVKYQKLKDISEMKRGTYPYAGCQVSR